MHRLARNGLNVTKVVSDLNKELTDLEKKPTQTKEDKKKSAAIIEQISKLFSYEFVNKMAVRTKGYVETAERKIKAQKVEG